MLCNKMWKPTLFNIKKGWVKLLLFMARVPDAFFLWVYRYNKP